MMQGSLAERLRILRAREGLTLTEASERIGITRHTLSSLERGGQEPHYPTLAKIAKGYGVPVEELLEEPVSLAEAPSGAGLTYEEAAEQLERRLARRNHSYIAIARGLIRYAQRWRQRLAAGDFDDYVLVELVADLEDFAPSVEANLAAERRELAERYDEQSALRPAVEELSQLVREALRKADAEQADKLASIEGRLEMA